MTDPLAMRRRMQRCDSCGRESAVLIPVPKRGWSSAWVCGDCAGGCTIGVDAVVETWEQDGMGMPTTKREAKDA